MSDPGSTTPLVKVEEIGDVALIWMSDEKRRNALSTALVGELINALEVSRTDGSRIVVLASGQKAFCAGADIRDMLGNGWLDRRYGAEGPPTPPELFEAIEADPRVIVAAVDGLALGGGVELCLACDLVVAGSAASFMFPEVSLGVVPNTAIGRLPQMIGYRAAAELILTRRRVDANEALRLGLVSALADQEGAVNRAVTMAQAICAGAPPAALTAVKRNLARGRSWRDIHAMLTDMDPAEWREGTAAFRDKRAPDYTPFWRAGLKP
jgi:enoyl-CoA hydratase/carnithine racemase